MLSLRKTIFYIFALIYLVLCPLMIARMLGFVINPLTHHWVKTGLVYVTTLPPAATLYVDGRRSPQKTPAAVRDLTPGEHFIRVELDGYKDWESHVPIRAKQATVMADTLLIPEEWTARRIAPRPYQDIFHTADDILVAINPSLKDIDIFRTSQNIEVTFGSKNIYARMPLFPANSAYAGGTLLHFFYANGNPFILLEAMVGDKSKYLWINLGESPPLIKDISAQDAGRLSQGLLREDSHAVKEKLLINNGHELLARDKTRIRLYTMEDFGGPAVYDITASKPSANIYFEDKTGELFFLDPGSFLSAVQVMPKS